MKIFIQDEYEKVLRVLEVPNSGYDFYSDARALLEIMEEEGIYWGEDGQCRDRLPSQTWYVKLV